MATTTRKSITKLEEGQRQKEVTINDALDDIDGELWNDMGEYTVAGLPDATANANAYALATDASGGRTIVRSDGTDWIVVVAGVTTVVST